MIDRRVPRSAVDGLDEFDTLQTLHEAAYLCLDEDCLEELTPGMRALTVLFVYVAAIDNGGFSSVMYNGTGQWTEEAIRAARLIGAEQHAAAFERFAEIGLGGDLRMAPEDMDARLEAMSEDETDDLEKLDDAFYALPSIDGFLTDYVNRRPEEFFTD